MRFDSRSVSAFQSGARAAFGSKRYSLGLDPLPAELALRYCEVVAEGEDLRVLVPGRCPATTAEA